MLEKLLPDWSWSAETTGSNSALTTDLDVQTRRRDLFYLSSKYGDGFSNFMSVKFAFC